ncbi:MMPL family transporter [Streptomyces sp. BR123]|uniref:MMPL family transporter n=1 Tax=Streptomyces sp. BR123 TaxID=2749828 RepID=UPI0015C4AB34|nr:MMPL family transporter [Streptomyces sp. BR123]NXY99446.1 MMPL family transporter [Streptomyces sp. BR123]
MFHALGRSCAVRPGRVLAVWLAVLLALAAAVLVHGRATSEAVAIPGSDSQAARDAAGAFPGPPSGNQPVVLHTPADGAPLTSDALRTAVQAAAADLARVDHVVAVTTPYDPAGRAAMSRDGHTAYLSVGLDVTGRDITPEITDAVVAAAAPAEEAGIEVTPGGDLAAAADKGSTGHSELIGLAAAAVILFAGLRRVTAAGLPIVVGVVGLVVSLALIGLAGHVMDMPSSGATIAAMIGLGVGIDYSLFCLTRFRDLLAAGVPAVEAAARTTATSGKAAAFAGCAVAAALAGLALGGLPLLHALALAPGIAVLVAVLAALTLLPALLSLLGRRLAPILRRAAAADGPSGHPGGDPAGGPSGDPADSPAGARWHRLAAYVAGRPWRHLLAGLALIAVLAAPAAQLTFGQLDAGDKPAGTDSRIAYGRLADAFGPGANGPLQVTASLPAPAADPSDGRLTAVTTALGQAPGVAAVGAPQLAADARTARWQVTPATGPGDPRTAELVDRLRESVLPAATADSGATAHVGGAAAAQADLNDRLARRMPLIIATVVAVAALLLLLAFRSPVVAGKAAVMNLLSVGAAYGVLTAVFQWGWGAGLIGLDGPVPIPGYVPLLMFAVLFGLSMDYEVFLLTAVRENWLRYGDNRRAVVAGLAGTGRIITSAALIMVSVFLSYLLSEDPVVKMFGIGLATAVALDATVVRGLLVPTSMVLLGTRNWWLPAWLDRLLPHMDIEGQGRGERGADGTGPRTAAPAGAAADTATTEPNPAP